MKDASVEVKRNINIAMVLRISALGMHLSLSASRNPIKTCPPKLDLPDKRILVERDNLVSLRRFGLSGGSGAVPIFSVLSPSVARQTI
jgi:hypothetical protein